MRARFNEGVQIAAIATLAVLAYAADAGAQDGIGARAEGPRDWETRASILWAQRVARHREPLADCRGAGHGEDEPGTVRVEVSVDPDGRVLRARAEVGRRRGDYERCVARIVRGWRLEPHSDRWPRTRLFHFHFDGGRPVALMPRVRRTRGFISTGPTAEETGPDARTAGPNGDDGEEATGTTTSGTTGRGSSDAANGARTGRVTFGWPDVRGSLSVDVIQRIVRSKHLVLRHCYELVLMSSPQLSGDLTVRFIIDADGTVTMMQVRQATLSNPRVERCVVRVLRRARFPQPPGGGIVAVEYPFQFEPVTEEPREQDPPAP